MLDTKTKQRAYAIMDDAISFRLDVVTDGSNPDVGDDEDAQALLTTPSVEAMREPVNLLRHLAKTFFGEKLTGVARPPDTTGAVQLFLVAVLAELDGSYVRGLSEDSVPAPTRPATPVPASQAETLKQSDRSTLRLDDGEGWD